MKKNFTLFFVLALAAVLNANNISITNLNLTGKNTASNYTMVQFDISWENSWRSSSNESNWDAAWVFVKYRVAGGAWQHAWLNEDGHTAPAGSVITPGFLNPGAAFNANTNPGMGAFIYRDANGTGTFSKTGVQLRWNYGANGVADGDLVEIKVFAVEMVYVPQGVFTVGSGGTEGGSLTNGSWTSGATVPLSIASENPLLIGPAAGKLWGTSSSGNNTIGGTGTLADVFPKGYNAFYCMKYEISQQQYVDFLNTLTSLQAANRYSSLNTGNRYAITASGGVYSTSNPFIACNYLSWMDGAAFSDWAGLRPMTELEYEKACRGTVTPVANEYAWGSINATAANNITNGGLNSETTNTSGANAVFNTQTNVQGPLRVGAFATGSTIRSQAGSSRYGIMEMSGNLWERTVSVGNTDGRNFTGLHGNGALSPNGHADVTAWPGLISGEITGASGSGFRGGSWIDDATALRVSDRYFAAYTYTDRFSNDGFRAVRTQPPFTCGVSTFTINHFASGGVAPVDKTVTYGTVSTTLFGGTKCAITRNLGASQQASAVTDATEASAGWYWQFNLKQGYKLADDGTTRTPTTTWINFISETSDWTAAYDPCALELGSGWRIPTNSEWTSADALWNNNDDPYASVLKLHDAGNLDAYPGTLTNRGSVGSYWSSAQYDDLYGWNLFFFSSYSDISHSSKAFGYSVRCLKDMLPTLTTTAVTAITGTTATSGGSVTTDGGSTITARGVCWGTTTGPTIALTTKTTDGTGTGIFTSSITGLAAGTPYYMRAYATNSAGTSYGNEVSFTTTACFIAGTKITMADGTLKNIEEIKVGEKVKSVKPETMEVVVETVEKTYANPPSTDLTKITFSNGQSNTNTRVHPYWVVGKGWSCVARDTFKDTKGFNAEPLAVGDKCQVVEHGKLVQVTITRIEDQPKLTLPTFNFTVSNTNCYFANGVLVHNKP